MGRQLRSDTLKKYAMFFMLIDHIGAVILERVYFHVSDFAVAQAVHDVYEVCRAVGRLAMPIFCYQLVVGFMRTHSRKLQLITLLIAGVLSEIPFDLSSSGKIYDPSYQNIMFTLALGVIAMNLIEWFIRTDIYKSISSEKIKSMAYGLCCTISVMTMSVIAEKIHSDYGAKAVILIFIFYFFKDNRVNMCTWGVALFIIDTVFITYLRSHDWHFVYNYCCFEAYACLAFVFINMDNGVRKGGKLIKWGGYLFYPLHMLVLHYIAEVILKCMI